MSKDNDKVQLYISVEWLKAFLKLMIIIIIPYNLVMLLLWKLSVLPGPVWHKLSMGGSFAIGFIWALIRKRRLANKEK